MKLALTAVISALVFSGCAGNSGKLADTHLCERSKPASPAVTRQFFSSNSLNLPGRSLMGGGKTDPDDSMTYVCIDPNDKTNAPQAPNLHKIRLPPAAAT